MPEPKKKSNRARTREIRERMARTGESYTRAQWSIALGEPLPPAPQGPEAA